MVSNTSAAGGGILIGRRQRHWPNEKHGRCQWLWPVRFLFSPVSIGFVVGREMECQPHTHAPSLPIATLAVDTRNGGKAKRLRLERKSMLR
jgi:hypothetical protein